MGALSRDARVAGFLYISASVIGVVRLVYIPSKLFVYGDATATAANVASHESLFRLGGVCYLIGAALWTFVPLALYRLFRDVDKGLATLMVVLGCFMQVPLFFCNVVNDVAALLFARGTGYLSVFDKLQRDAFARLFLDLHHNLDLANMMFAGLWLVPFGLLVYRSRFLPRLLGVWLMIACVPYLALSTVGFLFPGREDTIFLYGQPLMFAEVATMFWLLIMGAKDKTLMATA